MSWKRLKVLTFLFSFFLLGCASEESLLHYEYNGNRVTRLDIGQKTYLYEGNYTFKDIDSLKPSAIIDWQFDNYLFWFIQFQPDNSIILFDGGGGELGGEIEKGSKLMYSESTTDLLESYQSRDYNNLYQLRSCFKTCSSGKRKFRKTG